MTAGMTAGVFTNMSWSVANNNSTALLDYFHPRNMDL